MVPFLPGMGLGFRVCLTDASMLGGYIIQGGLLVRNSDLA